MKNIEIKNILSQIELSDESKSAIDMILVLFDDNQDLPNEKIEEIIDIIRLETELEDQSISIIDDMIADLDKASLQVDTLEKELEIETDAQEQKQAREENQLNDDLNTLLSQVE